MFAFLVRRVLLLSAILVGVPFAAFAFIYYGTEYKLSVVGCAYPASSAPYCGQAGYSRAMEIEGLNRPFVVQFADYVCGGLCVPDARRDGFVRGDFGGHYVLFLWLADGGVNEVHSTSDTIVRAGLPVSAQLGLAALVILYAVGVPLGTLAAIKRGAWVDTWMAVASTAIKSTPVFVLVPVVWIVVVLRLEILDPPSGWEGLFSASSILPVVVVALVAMPSVVRMTRAGVIDALSQDYVRTARAKGMPERMVVSRHVIRSALTPLVSGLVPTLAALLSGLLLVEVLFGILGFANVFIRSLTRGDGQTILAGVVVGTAAWAVCSLAADLLHRALDPRLRYDGPRLWSRPAREAFAA